MNHLCFPSLASLLAVAALAAGCAHQPAATAPSVAAAAATDCSQLDAEITRHRQALAEAQEQGRTAWKAVVPFAVAARHAKSRSAAAEAEQQLDKLQAEFARQGCARPAA